MQNTTYKTLLRNASQVVQISTNKQKFKLKEDLQNVHILENASVVVDLQGNIHAIGSVEEIDSQFKECNFEQIIDCTNKAVIPGFVDAHTHAICPGDRRHEFAMKLEGASYMEIHKQGGGIGFTVEHVRKATVKELTDFLLDKLQKMAELGTTTVEVKSGYGLDTENEIKMLEAITRAKKLTPLDLVSNYCGAHSIPKGMNEEEATNDIINNQIPAIQKAMQTGQIDPEFIDVFCEVGVYERESTKKILEAGKAIGLKINFHGDEIKFTNTGTLGAELGATAISHLENLDEAGIKAMAEKNVAAVILPTTHYLLKLKDPPVRQLIEGGVIFALGSDFNPNAYCMSMANTMNLVCINLKAKPKEALCAATLNSAASIDRSEKVGSIEIGKQGDFVVVDAPQWDHLIYQFGQPPIKTVIKKGSVIYNKN
ncbi:Metal-dependent hydrolase, composite domain [Pseudocohnilembus persalinus]|uniref:Probable imidazolonepropionase n=1 Tax=Pseudocohnilembus persalinus TaxID=266149 RepID=A0A0V0R2S3_PSEPJ|nr:Metal-dependent hydrolase, composite domain [Pseudocohnilembus persalinus]|eukprot:KRX08576.1 Metal-dependent hydrolase, composite domain [Pseudocohnilembus persalinus]